MRRQTPISHQLYAYLYPHPSPNDPPNFSAHLVRNLVPEVRIEVATFYGDLNSAEARYPGLNYCHPPHRMRLGRFKHHRRLFDAFDALGLTYSEIQDFCCWEGTRWARERYEKDEGVRVIDTTGDEIGPYVDRRESRLADEDRRKSITRQTDISVIVEEAATPQLAAARDRPRRPNPHTLPEIDVGIIEPEASSGAAEWPPSMRSADIPVDIATRSFPEAYRDVVAMLERGQSVPPELEQWFKEQSDRAHQTITFDSRNTVTTRIPTMAPFSTASGHSNAAGMTSRAAA